MKYTSLNLSFCGHAKHGKSTLAGRLAYELGAVTPRELESYAEEARRRGKDFNRFSMIFLRYRSDLFRRKSGLPADSSRTEFPARSSIDIDETRLTLIDTPGYSRFLDNIIYGIYLSDQAIVVVEANAGVEQGTESVCRILRAFNVPVAAFCVTKMDMVGYSQSRFEEIREEIVDLLFKEYDLRPDVPIVPVSALEGPGIGSYDPAVGSEMSWYEGDGLLGILDKTATSSRAELTKRIRLTIEGPREVFSPPGVGTVLVCTLESGRLKPGQELAAEPASTLQGREIAAQARSIHLAKSVTEATSRPVEEIEARVIVAVNVPGWKREDAESYFRRGGALGPREDRPRVARRILADVVFFERDTVYGGKEYVLVSHVAGAAAWFRKIVDRDSLSHDLLADEYSAATGELVRAEIDFDTPYCIEMQSEFPRLSRFVIREQNRIVACGKCIEIIDPHLQPES